MPLNQRCFQKVAIKYIFNTVFYTDFLTDFLDKQYLTTVSVQYTGLTFSLFNIAFGIPLYNACIVNIPFCVIFVFTNSIRCRQRVVVSLHESYPYGGWIACSDASQVIFLMLSEYRQHNGIDNLLLRHNNTRLAYFYRCQKPQLLKFLVFS